MDFDKQRAAALAILQSDARLSRRAGSFCGQLAVNDGPLSPKQLEWFGQLAAKAGVELEGRHS